jgi:hypothetical protein
MFETAGGCGHAEAVGDGRLRRKAAAKRSAGRGPMMILITRREAAL